MPPVAVADAFKPVVGHLRPVEPAERSVFAVLHRLDRRRHAPNLLRLNVDPLRVVVRIGPRNVGAYLAARYIFGNVGEEPDCKAHPHNGQRSIQKRYTQSKIE